MASLPAFLKDRRGRDYSLVELAAAGAIVAALVAVFLHQVRYYQEQAERSAVQSTVAALQNALASRAMEVLLKGNPQQIGQIEEENPMDWLAQQPSNYVGVFYGQPLERIPGGGWYFDRATRTLVYQVWRTDHFKSGSDAKADIHFRVVAEYGNLAPGSSAQGLKWLQIAPARPYRWFDQG